MSISKSPISSQLEKKANIWTCGMALFSMFFGAGNLIFPLLMSQFTGDKSLFVVMGLGLSAVLFPLLGLIAMLVCGGNLKSFLSILTPFPAAIILFLLHMAQGPLGSLPRLVIFMHASVTAYFPSISLLAFSFVICSFLFFMSAKRARLIGLIGVVLTPCLLLTLCALIGCGLYTYSPEFVSQSSSSHCFIEGLKGGYQTMDLIAALLFATIILPYLKKGICESNPYREEMQLRKRMILSSIVAAGFLLAAYLGLCLLSAKHGWKFELVAKESLLPAISESILGGLGGKIAACTIFLACFTTALSLVTICAQYLHKDLFYEKVCFKTSLFLTVLTMGAMANLGFYAIMNLVGPTMEILYPLLIGLSLIHIVGKWGVIGRKQET